MYIYIYLYIQIYIYVCMYVVFIHTYMHIYTYTYIQTYYIYMYVCCMYVHIHAYIHTHVHTCCRSYHCPCRPTVLVCDSATWHVTWSPYRHGPPAGHHLEDSVRAHAHVKRTTLRTEALPILENLDSSLLKGLTLEPTCTTTTTTTLGHRL
jgi:hypothetical protein